MKNKVAIVLCGSGFKDGSEIRESVLTLLALSELGIQSQCFAPDDTQADVINCLTQQPVPQEKRNMLVESARIARGDILPLNQLNPSDYDGILLPGGFGAAKNLCTFALAGSEGTVRSDLKAILEQFLKLHLPIGAICISPAILALTFKTTSLLLTLGEPSEASVAIEKLGHRHQVCQANEFAVDPSHLIYTTPAYMHENASVSEIYQGIHGMIQAMLVAIRNKK